MEKVQISLVSIPGLSVVFRFFVCVHLLVRKQMPKNALLAPMLGAQSSCLVVLNKED